MNKHSIYSNMNAILILILYLKKPSKGQGTYRLQLTGGVENHPFCVKIDPAQLLPNNYFDPAHLLLQTLSLSFGVKIQPMDVDTFSLFPNVNHFLKGLKLLTSLELKCFTELEGGALLPFYIHCTGRCLSQFVNFGSCCRFDC